MRASVLLFVIAIAVSAKVEADEARPSASRIDSDQGVPEGTSAAHGQASESSQALEITETVPVAVTRRKAVSELALDSYRSGWLCPEVCTQSQACIDGRCIEACVPECREGTYCTAARECMPVRHSPVSKPTEAEVNWAMGHVSAEARRSVSFDFAGVLFQGVQIGYEWGASTAWLTRLRLMNTGLMNYTVEPQNAFERFDYGLGWSFGFRRYEANWGNLRGFFYGAGLDLQAVAVSDGGIAYHRGTLLGGGHAEFGYRWVRGWAFFSLAPTLGIRAPLVEMEWGAEKDQCPRNRCPDSGDARFEGALSLEVGIFP